MLASRRKEPTVLNLQMNNTPIRKVEIHKHLGLIMNQKATWHDHINSIIKKANKRLGIIKKLKYVCERNTLQKLYVSYVRGILEYGDVVWDNIPQNLSNQLESIQIDALRCITGITISASKTNLYKETGLLPLSRRRKLHRLLMLYKMLHGLAPPYLSNLLPVNRDHPYQLRQHQITPFRCRTEVFQRSFLPATIREWNDLPPEIQNKPSIAAFKYALLNIAEFRTDKTPHFFSLGPRTANVSVTRMRNHCSALANDLFVNHVIDSPTCPNCNTQANETAAHFLLHCPNYNEQRIILKTNINTILDNNDNLHINILLQGHPNQSIESNTDIMEVVSTFLETTNRF